MWLERLNPPRRAPVTVHFGSVAVAFAPAVLDDGRHVLVAQTADPVVIAHARSMRSHYAVTSTLVFLSLSTSPVTEERSEPALERPGSRRGLAGGFGAWDMALTGTPPAFAAALANGWTGEDLAGTGLAGDFGPGGGISARTGLTGAEMALCRPPEGWAAAAATRWPWELLGFRGPGIGWAAPAAPVKPGGERIVAEPIRPDAETAPAPEAEANEPADDTFDPVVDEDETAPAGPESVSAAPAPTPPPAAEARPKPRTRPAELLEEWSGGAPAKVTQAVEILGEKWRESGSPPSVSKAGYWLNKNGLPRATAAVVAAILDLVPT